MGKGAIRATLRGYNLWAFERVSKKQGGESAALMCIMNHWLRLDHEAAAREFGISEDAYDRATGNNVAQMPKKKI